MLTSANDEFYEFERKADEQVAELPVWKKPLRSILSHLILAADLQFSGGRFGRPGQVNPEKGSTIPMNFIDKSTITTNE